MNYSHIYRSSFHYFSLFLLIIISSLVSIGCAGLFSPRKGDPPDSMTPAWWVAPVTQDDLEQDFINTYKFRNLTFYGKLLDDGFTFIPSSVDTSKFKNVYKNWNSETENKVTELIFQTYSSRINVELKNIRDEVDLPDSIRIFRSYSLEAKGWNVSGDSLKVFQGAGEMVLTLVPDPDTGTELLIKAWRDVRTTDLTETWGVLKLSIRQELP